MKKTMKKLFVLLLSAIMVMAMGVTAFAAGEATEGKLTINENEGNTYTAYQIMTSTVAGYDAEKNPLYEYTLNANFTDFFGEGSQYTLDAQNQILKGSTIVLGDGIGTNTNMTEASKLANALEQFALAHKITGTDVSSAAGATLAIGYYVIVETESIAGTAVASKPILVDLRGDVIVSPKDSKIPLDKVIVEDSKEVNANNVNIGDVVNYKVTTAIPTYEANVDKTKLSYILSDTFSTGLTYKHDVVIKAGDTTLAKDTDFTITEEEQSFSITLKQDTIYANQGKDIVLTYSAVLNPNAVVSSTVGNPNDITLEYTNNPNQADSKDIIKDKTITYTYGFKIHKVDKNDETKDMSGATFVIKDKGGKIVGNFSYDADGNIVAGENVVIAGNYATVSGLDTGTYTIEEIKAPNGYSVIETPVTVVITDKGETTEGTPNGIAAITVSGGGSATAEVATSTGDGTIDLVVKIVNVTGISLPETGAKAALYTMIGGAVLVILGGLYFGITKLSGRRRK